MAFLESVILGLSFALSGSIGPVSLEIFRRSLKNGFWSAFGIVAGATVVDFVYLAVIVSGIYTFLNVGLVNKLLSIFGVGFLLYLGVKSIRDFRKIRLEKNGAKEVRNSVVTGILLGFSSPFAIAFYLGVFGPVVTGAATLSSGLAIGLSIILGIFLGDMLKVFVGYFGKRLLTEKLIQYSSLVGGIALIGFALRLLYVFMRSIIS